MKTILVTGGDGQLGLSIRAVEKQHGRGNNFVYLTSSDFDLTNPLQMEKAIEEYSPAYIINCAAYTAVDKAENENEKAFAVNAEGATALARLCSANGIVLIHVSTDFVFEGNTPLPLTEELPTVPTGVYGESKLLGERGIVKEMNAFFILRTSWLYSEFRNNFLKTMIRLGNERDELSVVYDQIGTPTYAKDLAEVIFHIINSSSDAFGIYHYSNEGVASWYDFANEIFTISGITINLKPISSAEYPTPAKRPAYSVMNKSKIKESLKITINHWTGSLSNCIKNIQ